MQYLDETSSGKLQADIEQNPLHEEDVTLLKNGALDHFYFKSERMIPCAFQAYFTGEIDLDRLSVLCLFDEVVRSSEGREKVCLLKYPDGSMNEESFELMLSGTAMFMRPEDKEVLRELIRNGDIQDLQFFTVPYDHFQEEEASEAIDLIPYAYHSPLKFTFGVSESTPRQQIIIPPALMSMMLKARFGENAITPWPTFGMSPPDNFRSITERDVWIPCKYEESPQTVHYKNCNKLGAYWHDINYHCLVESANSHRKLWLEIANLYEKVKGRDKVWEYLLDRNYPFYLVHSSMDHKIHLLFTFWLILEDLKQANTNITPELSIESARESAEELKKIFASEGFKLTFECPEAASMIQLLSQFCRENLAETASSSSKTSSSSSSESQFDWFLRQDPYSGIQVFNTILIDSGASFEEAIQALTAPEFIHMHIVMAEPTDFWRSKTLKNLFEKALSDGNMNQALQIVEKLLYDHEKIAAFDRLFDKALSDRDIQIVREIAEAISDVYLKSEALQKLFEKALSDGDIQMAQEITEVMPDVYIKSEALQKLFEKALSDGDIQMAQEIAEVIPDVYIKSEALSKLDNAAF